MDHRASETYTAFGEKNPVIVHCMKDKDLIEILKTFPDAMAIFVVRAKTRRIEFRRIRKMYERWVNFDGRKSWSEVPESLKELAGKTYEYTEKDLPIHLRETDFYFTDTFKSKQKPVP